MAKGNSFVCDSCGFESGKWYGKCPNCGAWASIVEFRESRVKTSGAKKKARELQPLSNAKSESKKERTGISELDNALGDGLVPGQVILLAGEPGIGKSTLLLELAGKIRSAVYISGEESVVQIKHRADRMKADFDSLLVLDETNVDTVLATLHSELKKNKFKIVFIDSIQTMYTEDLSSVPGSIGQVREATFRLIDFAKKNGVPVILVGHVTKGGTVAGPATLAHMVDTVLWFEGDKVNDVRILRSIKNRFGSTDEVGVFKMTASGLASSLDTETLFLDSSSPKNVPGTVISCAMEGTRPFLIEVQSLVVPTKLAIPRRVVHGIDSRKAELIIAVLTRHCGLNLSERDIFLNIVGGIKIKDPGTDLAVALAIASSYKNKPIKVSTVAFGEIGLLGEIRESVRETKRIERARKQGYKNVVSSQSSKFLSQALKITLG